MSFITTSPDLLKVVKANLALQGKSLTQWSRENGLKRQNVTKAITGEWTGKKANEVLQMLPTELRLGS